MISKPILVKSSVTGVIREIIGNNVALIDALMNDYANLSALARLLRPKVSSKLSEKVTEQAIVSALKRIRVNLKSTLKKYQKIIAMSSLSVRTDLAKLSIRSSKENAEILAKLMLKFNDSIVQISWSPTAYTVVFDEFLLPSFKSSFKESDILEEKKNLAAVIVHSSQDIIETPGCVSSIISKVAFNMVNIEDIVSTYTFTLLLFKREDVTRAFESLNELISEYRRVKE